MDYNDDRSATSLRNKCIEYHLLVFVLLFLRTIHHGTSTSYVTYSRKVKEKSENYSKLHLFIKIKVNATDRCTTCSTSVQ